MFITIFYDIKTTKIAVTYLIQQIATGHKSIVLRNTDEFTLFLIPL